MNASELDLQRASELCPSGASVLSVTAAPFIRNSEPVYTHYAAMACWAENSLIQKRVFYQGQVVGLMHFMREICGQKSFRWDLKLMTPQASHALTFYLMC